MLFFACSGGVYLAWHVNATKIGNAYCDGAGPSPAGSANAIGPDSAQLADWCAWADSRVYDVEFLWWSAQANALTRWKAGSTAWTDPSEAQNLYSSIQNHYSERQQ